MAQHVRDVFRCAKCVVGTEVERIYSTYKGEKNWKFLREIWERGENSTGSNTAGGKGEVKRRNKVFHGGLAEQDVRGRNI